MKIFRVILIILVAIVAIGFIALNSIKQEINEDTLPTNIFEEDADLLSIVNIKLFNLFVTSVTNEYILVEEVINLIILDSVRENINAEYNPLSDCETVECDFIIHEDYYYLSYLYVVLNEDNQLVVYVSGGTDKLLKFNTVSSFVFDLEIDYINFEIVLTLDEYYLADKNLSMKWLNRIFGYLDKENIEAQVTTGILDLEEYSYRISFSPIP